MIKRAKTFICPKFDQLNPKDFEEIIKHIKENPTEMYFDPEDNEEKIELERYIIACDDLKLPQQRTSEGLIQLVYVEFDKRVYDRLNHYTSDKKVRVIQAVLRGWDNCPYFYRTKHINCPRTQNNARINYGKMFADEFYLEISKETSLPFVETICGTRHFHSFNVSNCEGYHQITSYRRHGEPYGKFDYVNTYYE